MRSRKEIKREDVIDPGTGQKIEYDEAGHVVGGLNYSTYLPEEDRLEFHSSRDVDAELLHDEILMENVRWAIIETENRNNG